MNKEKASAFLSTQEPSYLAGGNIKQKLMSTTKVVKEIEKLQGTEDAPLVASGKLRSTDKERVLNQIDQRRINLAEVAYLDLELATKIVKELEIGSWLICPQGKGAREIYDAQPGKRYSSEATKIELLDESNSSMRREPLKGRLVDAIGTNPSNSSSLSVAKVLKDLR